MKDAVFSSPVTFAQTAMNPDFGSVNGMTIALRYADTDIESARHETLSICDVSALNRFGVKGPNAAAWLASAEIALPDKTNSWVTQQEGAVVMRLGNSEFLIEDTLQSRLTEKLNDTTVNQSGIHTVLRNDAAFILSGKLIPTLFSEVCAIDLTAEALTENQLVMTVIAGISVTALKQKVNQQPVYRLWCDGTFGPYLWQTLLEMIEEQGGGAVGFNFYYADGATR